MRSKRTKSKYGPCVICGKNATAIRTTYRDKSGEKHIEYLFICDPNARIAAFDGEAAS